MFYVKELLLFKTEILKGNTEQSNSKTWKQCCIVLVMFTDCTDYTICLKYITQIVDYYNYRNDWKAFIFRPRVNSYSWPFYAKDKFDYKRCPFNNIGKWWYCFILHTYY